ncbi:hypothetical protein AJ80_06866 [Polytolypa hystricis UAMH7299]|uniref:Uncharacterized protein n=1 Tax=Polytolypa hystricis (strain UAMH7299) TaxID=1447883 RepID=A0A2B7XU84_POLH7|nr:hypothetical protein AJ80_06866 [Polytolypa hystricis UAMH7299]
MAAPSTTLITFLLRTPPNTRSVKLLGSWDNFTKPYSMERDLRIGTGHWRGCHTFTNIICDGETGSSRPGRNGGLKMGGTYWYYYQLDDHVEYYSEAEPSTTACPFLPGQVVNVLHVPINLPSSKRYHSRDSSVASERTPYQTMKPEDKYLNPRTPPRPKLPRLTTSPADLPQRSSPAISPLPTPLSATSSERSSSHPRATSNLRRFRLGGKLSLDLRRSPSPGAKSGALRTAFINFASPLPGASDGERERGRQGYTGRSRSTSRSKAEYKPSALGRSGNTSLNTSNPSSPRLGSSENLGKEALTLRVDTSYRAYSPQSRDRSTSRTREMSPLSNSVTIEDLLADEQQRTHADSLTSRLTALNESGTTLHTLELNLIQEDELTTPLDLFGKRLPTLPNSPSSVLDEELRAMDALNQPYPEEALQSHFSEFSDTASEMSGSYSSYLLPSGSRFSEYSTDAEMHSPSSMTSASTFNNDSACTDQFTGFDFAMSQTSASPTIVSGLDNPGKKSDETCRPSTKTSDLGISGLCIAKKSRAGSDNSSRAGEPRKFPTSWEGLVIRGDDYSSGNPLELDESALTTPRANQSNTNNYTLPDPLPEQSIQLQTTMQELMDELSYLGSMIEAKGC